jgi:tripartite ATP-independent transporter DctM subunit
MPNEIDTTLAPGAPAATGGSETCIALVALGNSLVDAVVAIALGAEVLIVFAGIITRSFFGHALLWTGEVSQIALATIGFVGGAAAYRDSHHAFLHVLLHRMRPGLQRAVAVGTEWIVVFTAGIIAWASVMLLHENYTDVMPLLRISAMWASLPLTIGMLLVVIYALQRLLSHGIRLALLIGAGLGGVVLAVLLTKGSWLSGFTGIAPLYADLITFIVSILIGLPVGLVMPLSAMMYLFTSGNMMIALPENMIDALTGFVLLALPFFVFAGTIMERGGISLRIIRFVQTLVGHVRGGLLQVLVLSMYLVSGLSGAKVADVAAVGSVMRDALRKDGYAAEEGAAILAVSAAMGETIPPSIAMLVLGSITSVSIGALFVGGLMPAAVVCLCIMLLIYVRARRSARESTRRASLWVMVTAGIGAVPPMIMPVIMIGGILAGIGTPTEVSSFAVIYGLALACIFYRKMGLRAVWQAMVDSAILSGMVLFIVAAGSVFAWVLTIAQVPQQLVAFVYAQHYGPALFMFWTVPLMIVAGSLVEGLPALLVLAPLLMPIATHIGINPVQYSMVLLIAMATGSFMPPIGVGFYVCCAVCRSHIEATSRAIVPYLVVLIAGLLIVAYVPWITLALPDALNFAR